MSNPVSEAVQRVKCAAWQFIDPPGAAEDVARRAATEALKPLRELHHPRPNSVSAMYPDPLCNCGSDWPCDTARLVYTDAELT